MEECYKALSDQLDWNNHEGDRRTFDLRKPFPLKGHLGHLTVASEYFFNNELEYLKSSDPEKKYTTSITKTKPAKYELLVALRMFTRSLIIKKRVKDVQLGVESYQKKLNITKPQKDFLGIFAKELYTPSFDPPGVVCAELSNQKRLM
ncbi:hypothetical protein Tco_0107645, partial [Tanacetum coccineum]